MLDLVGNPVDWFSHNEAHIGSCRYRQSIKSYWKDRKPIIDNVSLVKDFLRIYVFIFFLQRRADQEQTKPLAGKEELINAQG